MRAAASVLSIFLILFCFSSAVADGRRPPPPRVYISPEGGARRALELALNSAKREVCIAMYVFSSPQLAWKVISAKKRGVDVTVLLDHAENFTKKWSQARTLEKNGVPVAYVRVPRKKGDPVPAKFHHKFAVIDGETVITGSFNWSNMADTSNHENLLLLRSKEAAAKYLEAFRKARTLSKPR